MCMNGAAAHLIKKGEEIIVMGFELADGPIVAKQIVLGRDNEFVRWLGESCHRTSHATAIIDGSFTGDMLLLHWKGG